MNLNCTKVNWRDVRLSVLAYFASGTACTEVQRISFIVVEIRMSLSQLSQDEVRLESSVFFASEGF